MLRGDTILNSLDLIKVDNRGIDIFHCFRVAELSSKLCSLLKLSNREKEDIILLAVMHDIGKSMVDIKILNKTEKLNKEEWNQIKHHPIYGARIAMMMGYGPGIVQNILYHHENCNSTGYPKGLKDVNIPLGAAVIRICDSYDAMRSIRPYKTPMSHEKAIDELVKGKGIYRNDLLKEFLYIGFSLFDKYYK